jgi:hypothetical protein
MRILSLCCDGVSLSAPHHTIIDSLFIRSAGPGVRRMVSPFVNFSAPSKAQLVLGLILFRGDL